MLTPVESLTGDDEEDGRLLREMADEARSYIRSFSWCPPIKAMYLGHGIGGVVAIFLVEFERKIKGTDDRLWIIVGDFPSAYIVVEPQDSAREALERYCEVMDDWIGEVLGSGDFQDVFPVDAPRTPANADMLRRRLEFMRREIIPQMPADLIDS
jgi:hypothetical protein